MLTDVSTVLWKEWRELLAWQGSFRGGRIGMLVFAAVFGVYLPLQTGPEWVTSPISLVFWAWVPLFLVASVVADSFAGERERHTLETLLASRLSDRAILFGKVAAAVGYGWLTTVALILVGLVTINVANGGNGILLYPAGNFVSLLVLTLLMSLLVASAGVLVSLRAATVRQAAQTLAFASMALVFVPVLLIQLVSREVQASLITSMASGTLPINFVVGAVAVLLIADAALLGIALSRFQRARLILA